jgi:hypothetical protein
MAAYGALIINALALIEEHQLKELLTVHFCIAGD